MESFRASLRSLWAKVLSVRDGHWVAAALVLKISLSLFFVHFFSREGGGDLRGFRGILANDTGSYLQPVDDFLGSGNPSALFGFRMLGYGLPYLPFRLLLDKAAALNGLIAAQTVFSSLAVYLLALMAERICRSRRAFVVTFIGYFLVPIVSFYDVVALTESLSASLLVVGLYLLVSGGGRRSWLGSGICLAWCVFLKPIVLPLLVVGCLYVVSTRRALGAQTMAIAGVLLLGPFVVADGVWAAGRYGSGARENLALQSSVHPVFRDGKKHTEALVAFLQAAGEDWQDAEWFYSGKRTPCDVVTARFDCAAIADAQRRAALTQSDLVTFRTDVALPSAMEQNRLLSEDFRAYARSIKEERPMHYYLVAPGKYLYRLVTSSSTRRMFGDYSTTNPVLRPFRLGIDIIWWMLEACFFGLLLRHAGRLQRAPALALAMFVVVYFYAMYALVFRMNDFRYLVPAAPLLVLGIACLLEPAPPETR